jgi:hypothetical protein
MPWQFNAGSPALERYSSGSGGHFKRRKHQMGGKKGRSGPPGHLHTAKSVLPALARLRRGKPLPPELARVAAIADQEAGLLASDKGGLENLTGGERLMLNVWRTARQATLLILHELVERGATVDSKDGQWDLQPGTTRLTKFLAEEQTALIALKFDQRRPKDVLGLEEMLDECRMETEEAKVSAPRPGPEADAGTKEAA